MRRRTSRAAPRMSPEHPELTTAGRVEDADGGVLARRCDPRAVRAEDRAVDAAAATANAVPPADDDQLPARLGVEDPCAAVRARRRDARTVRADVDPDHRADRSVRSRVLIEDEKFLPRCGAPDAHRPFAPGGRDEPTAVRRECDVGVLVRLRPGQRWTSPRPAGETSHTRASIQTRAAPGAPDVASRVPARLNETCLRVSFGRGASRPRGVSRVPPPSSRARPRRRWRRAARRG